MTHRESGHHGRRRLPLDLPAEGERFGAGFGQFGGPDHPHARGWAGREWAGRGWGGRGGGRSRGFRGPRGRRGDVRAAILALLAERPMHGYEMLQELAERTHGLWRPSPGSLYPALQYLEDEGLVQSVTTDGRRRFELTDAGRADLAARPSGPAPWETVLGAADQGDMTLHAALRHLAVAVAQVADAGTTGQKAEAERLLSEVRRQVYLLLAEAPADEV
jgi:DNA-binding PadR family transcriptional regulator